MKSLANKELASCFDAQIWAKEFCKSNTASDEGTMLAWFAGAIMAGYDHANRMIDAKKSHACEVETDENSFVRDGVRYVAETYESCMTCGANDFRGRLAGSCMEIIGVSCQRKMRKDNRNIQWKRADTKPRPMTAREIYELAHQGAAFWCVSNRNTIHVTTKENVVSNIHREHFVYCLPSDMTDDEPKTWKWRPLTKEVTG